MSKEDLHLLPQHARLIEGSAIRSAVALARGYRSITTKAELDRLGFGRSQQRVPALLLPIHGVNGEVVLHQIRPDAPRMKGDKPIKYETPFGSRLALDVHPFARPQISDPDAPLFVTEGIRKGDAAVSKCLCCIGLLGVWGWRGTNERGGNTALPDWEDVHLKGRPAYVVFDSDVMTKEEVEVALSRFKAFLKGRGADVQLIYLPPQPNGAKMGLDDFLVAGHGVDDLLALASSELRESPRARSRQSPTSPYLVHAGCISMEKDTRDGPVIVPLCNFDARISEQLTLDDGDTQSHEFSIRCTLAGGNQLPVARVATDRFAAMGWVTNSWGVKAVIGAGFGKRDQLREAILKLSMESVRNRRIYTHTGWREIDGEACYLSAAGAVGRDDIEVELGHDLSRYKLPNDPENVVPAVRQSLRLLDVADPSVTIPLWAAVFRAVLASLLPVDVYLWLEGLTGSLKSTLVALFLCHWGRFDHRSLPDNWESTANVLEKRAYSLKDAVFLVDDYAPNAFDVRDYRSKAARLLRSQGNLSGRGRLRSDLTERKTFRPRGLILSTGEQRPSGQSIIARGFFLELERRQVDLELLTAAQQQTACLSHAMAGYTAWLAPQYKTLRSTLEGAFETARRRAADSASHLRHPGAVAHLWLGMDCGIAFAEERGAIDAGEASELRGVAWETLIERAKAMAELVGEESPTRRFAEILATLILQGRCRLLPRESSRSSRAADQFIGWYDTDYLYVLPDAVFRAVSQFAREGGDPFPVDRRRLQLDLVRQGVAEHAERRTTITLRVGSHVQRVLQLRRAALAELYEADHFPDSPASVTDVTDVTGFSE